MSRYEEAYLSIRELELEPGVRDGRGGLSLRVMRGEFMEILGIDGSGKDALARFLDGRAAIRSGLAVIGGRTFRAGDSLAGFDGVLSVSGTPKIADELTVAENICVLSRRRKTRVLVHRANIAKRVSFLLSEYGLSVRAEQKAGELTEGERIAVELLRAVENEIPLVCVDVSIERIGRQETLVIERCLMKMKRQGITILCLGSGFPKLLYLDDRVTVLRNGRNVRTFYRDSYDRDEFIRWVLGISRTENAAPDPSGQERENTEKGARPVPLINAGGAGETPVLPEGEGRCSLEVRGLTGRYLRDFSFRFPGGGITGLYDMNNVMNRELAGILTGQRRPAAGSVTLDGRRYAPLSLREAVAEGAAYIPPDIRSCSVVEGMGIGENLLLPVMKEFSRGGILQNRRVARYLESENGEFLKLENPDCRSAAELGAYDRMRIALGKCLLMNPRLVIGVDILNDVDVKMMGIETAFFGRLAARGATVLLSSQNLTALRRICGRILVMNSSEEEDQKKVHLFETQSD